MPLSPEAIRHLAWLARLELASEEAARLQHDLDGILEYVRVLDAASTDVADVGPIAPGSALREDEARPGATRDAALANAPERIGEFFAVPPVVERT